MPQYKRQTGNVPLVVALTPLHLSFSGIAAMRFSHCLDVPVMPWRQDNKMNRNFSMATISRIAAVTLAATLLMACSDSSNSPSVVPPEPEVPDPDRVVIDAGAHGCNH